jgi:hypothetical protein
MSTEMERTQTENFQEALSIASKLSFLAFVLFKIQRVARGLLWSVEISSLRRRISNCGFYIQICCIIRDLVVLSKINF